MVLLYFQLVCLVGTIFFLEEAILMIEKANKISCCIGGETDNTAVRVT